jgi:uncharacterized membrane protein
MRASKGTCAFTGFLILGGMTGCVVSSHLAHPGSDNVANPRTYVFMCPDGSSYVVRATESEAWVFRPGSGLRLEAVPGSIPFRYAHNDVHIVIDSENGVLSEPGVEGLTCRNDRRRATWEHAKLDGVDFRAVGNEPPWVLEMRQQSRIVLITDYGAQRIERPLPDPISNNTLRTTRWDAGDLQIEITAEICHDTMSGEPFHSGVVVYWQGKVLKGCGRSLH